MKLGLDDFFASGGTVESLLALASSELRQLPGATANTSLDADPQYFTQRGSTYWLRQTNAGSIEVSLANFTAQIVEEVVEDDGVETRRNFHLAVLARGQSIEVIVPADRFGIMNWPAELLGPGAIVAAGMGNKDRLREAIQVLSPREIPTRRVYRHLGWITREGEHFYIHAAGAIGAAGVIHDIEVRLDSPLDRYCLPAPPAGEELRGAILESLALLAGLASDRVMFPLFALLWTTVVEPPLESIHTTGMTGVRKTELIALIQRHHGASMTAENLPCSWSSTGNAIEATAFYAKDSVLTVDDYCPMGTAADVQRYNREADRVFRGRGNSSGRGRARQDGTPRPPKPPRAGILSSGEDVPHGHSMRARMLVITVEEGEVNLDVLTARQAAGDEYPKALAGFVTWVASRRTEILRWLHAELPVVRKELLAQAPHGRTASVCAKLILGQRVFLTFAKEAGAITQEGLAELDRRGRAALLHVLADQAQHQAASDPAKLFIQLVGSALMSGDAYLADRSTLGVPAPETLARAAGWQRSEAGDGSGLAGEWRVRGPLIGWLEAEADAAYLLLTPAHRAAQKQSDNSPARISIGEGALAKRLDEAGMLVSHDEGRNTKKVRVGDRTQGVLHLRLSLLLGEQGTEGTEPGTGPERAESPDSSWDLGLNTFPFGADEGTHCENTSAGDTGPDGAVPDVPSPREDGSSAEEKIPPLPCHLCHGRRFWRLRSGGPVVCGGCRQPQPPESEIEWIEVDRDEEANRG